MGDRSPRDVRGPEPAMERGDDVASETESTYANEALGLPRSWFPTAFAAAAEDDVAVVVPVMGEQSGPSVRRRAWFRWITGHQACFLCWRLAGMNLLALRSPLPREHADGLVAETVRLIGTSAAMVGYAGSCSVDTYRDVIRPAMAFCHPSFTGRWSLDFEPLAGFLHMAPSSPSISDNDAAALRSAFTEYLRTHRQVAMRLVPHGGSLLRERGGAATVASCDRGPDLFDAFFLVKRVPARGHEMRSALVRRLARIGADLQATADADPIPRAQDRAGTGTPSCSRSE